MTTKLSRRDDLPTLTQLIVAIDTVKAIVPLQLGQGILAMASAILIIIKVSYFWM